MNGMYLILHLGNITSYIPSRYLNILDVGCETGELVQKFQARETSKSRYAFR